MRKKTSYLFLTVLLIGASFVIFYSCAKNAAPVCETCITRKSDQMIQLTYKTKEQTFDLTKTYVWKFYKENTQENADTRFENMKLLFPKNENKSENDGVFLAMFYINKLLSIDSTFTQENISAYSTFKVVGNLLQHDFYQRTGDVFAKIQPLSIKTSLITDNAIEYIRNNIVYKGNNSNTTVLSISNGEKINIKTRNRVDYLHEAAKQFVNSNGKVSIERLMSNNFRIAPDSDFDGNNCMDRFCPNDNLVNHVCVRKVNAYPAEFYCLKKSSGGGGCSSSEYKQAITNENHMDQDSVRYAYDDVLHYEIKDTLVNTYVGRKYITYYYFLSDIYMGQADIFLMLKTTRSLYKFNTSLQYLKDPVRHGSEIFLNSELKNEIVNLINDYRELYTDEYVDQALDEIIEDMNWAVDKTVAEVSEAL